MSEQTKQTYVLRVVSRDLHRGRLADLLEFAFAEVDEIVSFTVEARIPGDPSFAELIDELQLMAETDEQGGQEERAGA
jgi:hypothetical protein